VVTVDEHWLEAEELRAGAMRMVCGNRAVCDFGQSHCFVPGLRREGQNLRNATGANMSSVYGQRTTRRNSLMPELRGDRLVVGGLRVTAAARMTTDAATNIFYLLKIFSTHPAIASRCNCLS
jgi:hypothetical protein